MGTELLVDEDIRLGRDVVEALEKADFPHRAALWYFAPEFDDWRLVIATPLVEEIGSPRAYKRLSSILKKHETAWEFPSDWIWLVDPDFPALDAIARRLHLGRKRELRYSPTRIAGLRTSEAIVYHLRAR